MTASSRSSRSRSSEKLTLKHRWTVWADSGADTRQKTPKKAEGKSWTWTEKDGSCDNPP